MRIEIKSVLSPDKVAYRLCEDWNWNEKGNAPLSLYLTQYETYGDGIVQHSGQWCVQWHELTDACLSVAAAVVADPLNEAWRRLSYMFRDTRPDLIAFAMGIKYRSDKAQWFNIGEHKTSSAESKRHDKRWAAVESWMDGSPASVLSILLNGRPSTDWLEKLCIADDLRQAMNYPLWEELFKPTTELKGDWHQAFNAVRHAARAVASLDNAKHQIECSAGNSRFAKEIAA